jgi:hypothetical protein
MVDEAKMNSIVVLQDEAPQIELLRARQQIYARATGWMIVQMVLAVAAPVGGEIVGLIWPPVRPYVGAAAFVFGVLDVWFLDRAQTRLLKIGAKLQEQFDCAVLGLPWDDFTVGAHVDPEDVHEAATAYVRRGGTDDQLRGWYPAVVAEAPLHLGRLICQRTNLWYDSRLRRHYGVIILGLSVALFAALFIAGLVTHLTLTDFVVTILVPAAPFLTWSIREWHRQRDTAGQLDEIRKAETALWAQAQTGGCTADNCLARSREFQNAIYARRSGSPLIFPFIYKLMRGDLEDQMNAGAAERMRELGLAVNITQPGTDA